MYANLKFWADADVIEMRILQSAFPFDIIIFYFVMLCLEARYLIFKLLCCFSIRCKKALGLALEIGDGME